MSNHFVQSYPSLNSARRYFNSSGGSAVIFADGGAVRASLRWTEPRLSSLVSLTALSLVVLLIASVPPALINSIYGVCHTSAILPQLSKVSKVDVCQIWMVIFSQGLVKWRADSGPPKLVAHHLATIFP